MTPPVRNVSTKHRQQVLGLKILVCQALGRLNGLRIGMEENERDAMLTGDSPGPHHLFWPLALPSPAQGMLRSKARV